MDKSNSTPQIQLFENIALAFSGGGFRAAAFCLGVLKFLHEFEYKGKPLLEHVRGLSTVSGGTITGAMYAQSLHRSQEFSVFFKEMNDFLSGDLVLNEALVKMEDHQVWAKTHKKQSLINAFSLAYHKYISITIGELKAKSGHLEDICFNATEFSFGLAFRFQIHGDFGNYRVKISDKAKQEILVADAMASSSCFPMGFAPLIMPDDYYDHKSESYKSLKAKKYFDKGIGIMDGGIVDNQGIGSTMLADKRRANNGRGRYDLILVCDVASYNMKPWEQDYDPIEKSDSIGFKIQKFVKLIKSVWPIFLIGIVGVGSIVLSLSYMPMSVPLFYVFGGMCLAVSVIWALFHRYALSGLRWVKNKVDALVPTFFLQKIHYFDNLRMSLVRRMAEERISSGMKMVNEVFLKQIRRLNYQLFYADDELKNRRATALIYELTKAQHVRHESTEIRPEDEMTDITPPSEAIFKCAKKASDMGTTLWFTDEEVKAKIRENLVACGRFTACYTLIKYLEEIDPKEVGISLGDIAKVKSEMASFWNRYVKDPFEGL